MYEVSQQLYHVSVQMGLFFLLFDVINIKICMINIKRTHYIWMNI